MLTTIRVLIADDHHLVREGVRTYLQTQPDIQVVAEAATGLEAIQLSATSTPDVVLLDLVMPELDGIGAIHQIRVVSPHTQIIVLTSFHDDEYIFPAIKAGALSYLLKDVQPKVLVEAIRQAARGEATLHPHVATRLVREIRMERANSLNPFIDLTDREYNVLRLVAQGRSNAEIAQQLMLSEKTIKGYVSSILQKLHLADRTQAAVLAWQKGLMRGVQ